MLVVEPEKRLTLPQIAKHRWLSDAPPVDTGPDERDQQPNETVIDHMLQLPGLNKQLIRQSLANNNFDHIYAIYNLLVDKLHQRTVNFQTKLLQRQEEDARTPKMNERSESFNERLVKELGGGSGGQISEVSRSGSCDVSFDRDLRVTNPILGLKISLEDFFVFFF